MEAVSQKRVLYIEDNPTNIQLVGLLFRKLAGVELIPVTDGRHGLVLAQELLPSLILLDINMPEMTGYQVLEKLRQTPATADIPVIAVTANGTDAERAQGERAGFDEYITKPLNAVRFLGVMQNYLGTKLIQSQAMP